MIKALTPNFAIMPALVPPTLDSLMPPVSGLFAPKELRPELDALVPESSPGAKTSLLLGPKGWHSGSTSSLTTVEVKPLPPRPIQCAGTSSILKLRFDILTR